MEIGIGWRYKIECDFCNSEQVDTNLQLAVLMGVSRYGYCPICKGFVSQETAASDEWRKKVDEYYAKEAEK